MIHLRHKWEPKGAAFRVKNQWGDTNNLIWSQCAVCNNWKAQEYYHLFDVLRVFNPMSMQEFIEYRETL